MLHLGCGMLGHWLFDCPSVNNRLKNLALEALHTRKQVRHLQSARSRDPSSGRPRSVLLTLEDEGVANAQVEAEERGKSPEQTCGALQKPVRMANRREGGGCRDFEGGEIED